MVVAKDVAVQRKGLLHIAHAQDSASYATSVGRRAKPLPALHHFKQVAVRILQVKMLAAVGSGVHRTKRGDATARVLRMHGIGVLALDLADENPRVAELAFEGRRLRLSARELPNFHAGTSSHVKGQCRVPCVDLATRVARHQRRFGRLLKHADVDAERVSVPLPCFVHIGNANAHLLNAADPFCHGAKMMNDVFEASVSNRAFLNIGPRRPWPS